MNAEPPALTDASCVVHVHSRYSDGNATPDEITAAAAAAGHDVVLLTDHDTMQARREGWEGRHGSTLLLVGVEVSPKGGHYLAFGLDREVDHTGLSEEDILAAVKAGGGFGFVAHPFSRGAALSRRIAPAHGWTALDHPSVTGIELWSLATDCAEAWRSVPEAIRFLRRPEERVTGPPASHLDAWDRLCRTREVAAIGGLDAHNTGFRLGRRTVSVMPNARYFRLLSTHVMLRGPLTGELERDRKLVFDALRAGRCYLALDFLERPQGFAFWAEGGGETALMGERRDWGSWTLHARAPREARFRLIGDGAAVAASEGNELSHAPAAPGAYRVECRLPTEHGERLWVVSNPIYLRGEAQP